MANLTIVVDDRLLKQARMRALEDGTSVNAVLRTYLERYAGTVDTTVGSDRICALGEANRRQQRPLRPDLDARPSP